MLSCQTGYRPVSMETLRLSPDKTSCLRFSEKSCPATVSQHETVCPGVHWPFTHVHSLTALMQPSYQFTHGESMAPRSGRVLLSRPSSLPGHSDSPNVHDRLLPVSSGLQTADRRRSVVKKILRPCRDAGVSGSTFMFLSSHAIGLTPGP
jgi:hypothetical protein